MARRTSARVGLRSALWLLLVVLAAAQVQALVLQLHSQAQTRARWVADVRQRLMALRPHLEETQRGAGPAAMLAEARRLLAPTLRASLLDARGSLLADDRAASADIPLPAMPGPDALADGDMVAVGPADGSSWVVTYAPITPSGGPLYLVVVHAAGGLAQDLADRRTALFVHGLCLILAVLVAFVAALASRETAEIGSSGAMSAYEEAMARLRVRGDEVSRAHAEELRHLRETVRDREAMARAGELTAGIVHEVRNGLGTILGYARLIERDVAPESPAAKMALGLVEEARALEGVIRRIVEFVRTEELRPSEFDLTRLLERVVARELRAHDGAPASIDSPAGLRLVADEDLLERALENLVRNARDAAGPEGRVAVEARRAGADITIIVSDDGPGLPPELAGGPKAFVTTKRGGLGLGLPTALKILALHGGRLALRPREPRGLAAEVVLPAAGPGGSLPLVAGEPADGVGKPVPDPQNRHIAQ
jgi:signal transduction histidine kinase